MHEKKKKRKQNLESQIYGVICSINYRGLNFLQLWNRSFDVFYFVKNKTLVYMLLQHGRYLIALVMRFRASNL